MDRNIKTLKILFLTNRIPYPINDGQSRRTYNILKGLSENNKVYLLSLSEEPEEIESANIRHMESICHKVETIPFPHKKINRQMLWRLLRSLISLEPYTIWRHFSKLYLTRIHELIKEIKFDIVHCDILPLAYTIKNIKKVPCTLTDHDISYLKALRMARICHNLPLKLFLFLEAFKLKKYESIIFKHADIGIVVSEHDKKHLQRLCPIARFEVIENGVDTNLFKTIYKPENKTLLWVGGFKDFSNEEALFFFLNRIYPLIKKNIKNIKLNLIGGGASRRLLHFAKVDSSINFTGFVDNILPYFEEGAVFIVPILSGSGTRLKVLEAMAAGLAIVSTGVGVEGIDGKDKTQFLIADSPKLFANSVTKLILNPDLRFLLGNNARETAVNSYDWKVVNQKLSNLYRKIAY